MAAEVISTSSLAGDLDAELEKARATLKGVEDNIKRVFGKDSSEIGFQRNRRSLPLLLTTRGYNADVGENGDHEFSGNRSFTSGSRGRDSRLRRQDNYVNFRNEEEPMEKRRRSDNFDVVVSRTTPIVIGPRIKPNYESEEEDFSQAVRGRVEEREPRRLQSRIVSSIKEKSRDEVLAEQRQDMKGSDRNRRMFGALLGTLQRFKQDETKLKKKEDKRAQIEAKLDEAAKQERESVKQEKQQLIRDRKLKLTEIKRLEIKKRRLAELEEWETKTNHLTNFIRTESKPHLFYLPKILNPIMECRLEASKQLVAEMIVNKRKIVFEDLDTYEQKSKRYWDQRLDGRDTKKMNIDPLDANIEDELKELMKADGDIKDGTNSSFLVIKQAEEESAADGEEVQDEERELIDDSPTRNSIKIDSYVLESNSKLLEKSAVLTNDGGVFSSIDCTTLQVDEINGKSVAGTIEGSSKIDADFEPVYE